MMGVEGLVLVSVEVYFLIHKMVESGKQKEFIAVLEEEIAGMHDMN